MLSKFLMAHTYNDHKAKHLTVGCLIKGYLSFRLLSLPETNLVNRPRIPNLTT
mgnify:FL=1